MNENLFLNMIVIEINVVVFELRTNYHKLFYFLPFHCSNTNFLVEIEVVTTEFKK